VLFFIVMQQDETPIANVPASEAFFFKMLTCASSSAIRRWLSSPSSNPEATGQYDPQLGHRTAGMGLLDENSTAVLAAVIVVVIGRNEAWNEESRERNRC
jgi:hypothetical protein